MQRWTVRQAKAQFSAMVDTCLSEGPQLVTRHGIDTAVLVRADEWQRLRASVHPSLKQLLLAEGARCTPVLATRSTARRRPPAAAR